MEISKYPANETAHLQKECTLQDFAQYYIRPTTEEEIFCQVVKLTSNFC